MLCSAVDILPVAASDEVAGLDLFQLLRLVAGSGSILAALCETASGSGVDR